MILRIFQRLYINRWHLQQKRPLALSYSIVRDGESTQPPLLMIHGLLGNKYNFNFVRKLLHVKLPGTTVISCDVRNHGESPHSDTMDYKSMSNDVLELMESEKLPKCNLLGHSLGGRIAMHTALTHGDKVDKLIIVDVSPGKKGKLRAHRNRPFEYMEAMKLVKFQAGMKRSQARASASRQLSRSISEKSIRDFVLTNLTQNSDGSFGWRVNISSILQNLESFDILTEEVNLTSYSGKTLFLGGELSEYITPDDIPDIKALFPNAVIKHVPGCGHWVHADDPHAFTDIVANFLLE